MGKNINSGKIIQRQWEKTDCKKKKIVEAIDSEKIYRLWKKVEVVKKIIYRL